MITMITVYLAVHYKENGAVPAVCQVTRFMVLMFFRDGRPVDLSGIPDLLFFFTFVGKKKPEPGKLTIFLSGKNSGMIRHYCRPATRRDLIGISRFFSTNLEVSRFPDSTSKNPRFLFCFEIEKTKRRFTVSHAPCLQAHKAWAKNKFYDRLN